MPHTIALLRGINVGGKRKVAMSDLRDMLTALGFADAKSLLNSGNLVFRCNKPAGTKLELLLEAETEKRLALTTQYHIRTAKEIAEVIANNPFQEAAKNDPGHLIVMFLKSAPDEKNVKALQAAITGRETMRAVGKHLYAVYPDGAGTSKLTSALIDRKLGTSCTGRNWNTVLKLGALTAES